MLVSVKNGHQLEMEYILLAGCVKRFLASKQVHGFMSPREKLRRVTLFTRINGAVQSDIKVETHPRWGSFDWERDPGRNMTVVHVGSRDRRADAITMGLP